MDVLLLQVIKHIKINYKFWHPHSWADITFAVAQVYFKAASNTYYMALIHLLFLPSSSFTPPVCSGFCSRLSHVFAHIAPVKLLFYSCAWNIYFALNTALIFIMLIHAEDDFTILCTDIKTYRGLKFFKSSRINLCGKAQSLKLGSMQKEIHMGGFVLRLLFFFNLHYRRKKSH